MATLQLKDQHTLRIFISSPFNGMELERQRLSRLHWPRLEAALATRGLQLRTVDMRWGITSESSADSQVISICLRELDRSDVFVGFFGQRYGWHGAGDAALQENFDKAMEAFPWVDKFRDRSVTELEFLHGHLNHPGKLPAVICFRDKAWDDARRDEGVAEGNKRTIYKFSAESEQSSFLMDDLKRRVEDTESQTLGIDMCYHHPDQCADFMFDKLWEYLQKTLLSDDVIPPTVLQQEAIPHTAYMTTRRGLYVGAAHGYEQLDQHVKGDTESGILVLTGEAGIGKTALISNWIQHRENNHHRSSSDKLIYHFVGADKASTDTDTMLVRLLSEIHHHVLGTTYSRPEVRDSADLARQVAAGLRTVGEKHADTCLVLVLDGLGKLDPGGKTGKPLFWLPRTLPDNVRVLVALTPGHTRSDEQLETLQNDYDATVLPVASLTEDQKNRVCNELLKMNSKSLSPEQLNMLVTSDRTAHPLYLRVIIEELCVYGNFRQLSNQIEHLLSCEGVAGLFSAVIERLEKDYNHTDYQGNMVEEILCALCCCKNGVAEGELPVPTYMWAPLYYSMQKYLISRGGLLSFAFDEMYKVVQERYMDTPEKKKIALARVIKLFNEPYKAAMVNKKTPSDRCVIELSHLLCQSGDVTALIDVISDVTVFDILYRTEAFVLLEYWRVTELQSDVIARRYLRSLDMVIADRYIGNTEGCQYFSTFDENITRWEQRVLNSLQQWFEMCKLFQGLELITHRWIQFEERRPYEDEVEREQAVTKIQYSLACHYCETARYKESIALHEKVLRVNQRLHQLGKLSEQELGRSYHGLGTCYYNLGQSEKSEEMYLKAMSMQSSNPGHTADTLCNLANIYGDREDYPKAVSNLLQAVKIREEEEVAELTISMAYLYNNLGLVYRKMGDFTQAEVYYVKALKVKERVLGRMSLDTAYTLLNLGALQAYIGNFPSSLDYYQQALSVFEVTATEQPHLIIMSHENIALTLTKLDRFEEAEPIYMKAYEALMNSESKLARGLASLHREMVNYYARQENWRKAGDITVSLIESGVANERDYALLDMVDANLPERPQRPQSTSLDAGLQRFPDNPMLLTPKLKHILQINSGDALTSFIRNHCEAPSASDDVMRGKRHLVTGAILTASLGAHQEAIVVLEAGCVYAPENQELISILAEARSNLENATNQPAQDDAAS